MAHDLPPCPEFDGFYRAVNGRDPFPWQSRLAGQVRSGDWPSLIGIPTGLGKTSCLEVAVWALAAQADLEPENRTAPTRVWWVVNRRLLVDDTFRGAERLGELLMKATEGDLYQVAERLRSLSSHGSVLASMPLQVIRLRGGVGVDRPNNPAQPAVICTTIPMYGSRVLFRGYGSSRSTRPIDAALAYTDSLVICDEAHLARHLVELFKQLAELDGGTDGSVLPGGRSRPKVVTLTATGDPDVNRFDLDGEDLAHEVVRKRYFTRKPVKLVSAPPTEAHRTIANHLVEEVSTLLVDKPASSCLVFVNTPATARAVVHRLKSPVYRKRMSDPTIVMLTGRMREREADVVRKRVLDTKQGMRAGDGRGDRDRHLIVVATQTLEVGADLDAQHLVTEACARTGSRCGS
ncbi:MAG: type I-U CRISPR-associated helicase/endonuclease Cas3 [bacterium]|nr:type I-U CRISPR-associated helicase/endonuclease Cas3 [bacterium]